MVKSAPLIICVVLLVFVIGVLFVLLWMNTDHITPHEHTFKQHLKIENASHTDKNVTIGDLKFILPIGANKHVTIPSDSKIEIDDSSLTLPNSNMVNTVYITENGIFTNLKCGKGMLTNLASYPETFVEIGKDKKWNMGILYQNESLDTIISKGSKWEVISPERSTVLGSIKTQNGLKIIFDGKDLYEKD